MTELEKMLAGEPYDCSDDELLELWHLAKKLTQEYNSLNSKDLSKKKELLKYILGEVGENLWVTPPFYVDYGYNIFLGNNCEINMNCVLLDCNKIIIGDNALIAPFVQIYTAYHPTHYLDRFENQNTDNFQFCLTKTAPVTIGNNVWIGGGAIILPGVNIGDNVVIGAGSVVTKDIPSDTIAFGNPCVSIKENLQDI